MRTGARLEGGSTAVALVKIRLVKIRSQNVWREMDKFNYIEEV